MNTTNNADEQHRLRSPHLCAGSHLILPAGGLRVLLAAYECASELAEDVWEFAVEARCLESAGLTNTHLRWLLYQGYALQGVERTAPRERRRRFHRKVNLSLSTSSCFVLTEVGAAYARGCARLNLEGAAPRRGECLPQCANVPPQRTSVVGATPGEPNGLVLAYQALRAARLPAAGRRHRASRISVPIERLRQMGVEEDVLLRMMYHAHVGHVIQPPGSRSDTPRPCPIASVRIGPGSRFFLTDAGEAFAARFLNCGQAPAEECALAEAWDKFLLCRIAPRYDKEQRIFFWGAHALKCFRQMPGNQELILAAAEELRWPAWFDDPLPRRAAKNPKILLHDTVRDLNRRQTAYLIHFTGDGTGTRVGWEFR